MNPLISLLRRASTLLTWDRAVTTLALVAIVWVSLDTSRFGWADEVFCVLATAAALAFCIIYAAVSHGAWLRTRFGRHLMVLTFFLFLLGARAVAVQVWPPSEVEWPRWLGTVQQQRTVIYGVLAYQLLNRNLLLLVAQARGEKRRKATMIRPVRPEREHHAKG